MRRSEERKVQAASISFKFACVTLCQPIWKTPMLRYPMLLLLLVWGRHKKIMGQLRNVWKKTQGWDSKQTSNMIAATSWCILESCRHGHLSLHNHWINLRLFAYLLQKVQVQVAFLSPSVDHFLPEWGNSKIRPYMIYCAQIISRACWINVLSLSSSQYAVKKLVLPPRGIRGGEADLRLWPQVVFRIPAFGG